MKIIIRRRGWIGSGGVAIEGTAEIGGERVPFSATTSAIDPFWRQVSAKKYADLIRKALNELGSGLRIGTYKVDGGEESCGR